VSEKTKCKHTKFVLYKSNLSLEREKKKTHQTTKTRDLSQCGLAIYIKKYLKAKEELWNLNISPCKNILIFKKSSKRNPKPSRY
jgi:hypothetical protein